MRELVVISGKGGTGKTSLTAAFAFLAKNIVLCDADVDASDLHLLTEPFVMQKSDFKGGFLASINKELCMQCNICVSMCRFGAIDEALEISKLECEGCGICVDFCPANAIAFTEKTCGQWFVSQTRMGPMVHARLGIAEENSGKLVSLVRQEAKKLAQAYQRELIITDGPPGVGCPVIASIGDATALLVIVEPSVSGIHDMDRVVQLARRFRVPVMVCVNKWDINQKQTAEIEIYAEKQGLNFLGKVPYDALFTQSMVQRKTIFEHDPSSETCRVVKDIWKRVLRAPEMNVLQHCEFN
ncbi:MAG: 4Fe-4S binding protein [Proteobacteria bacterium]|nr:4Fe-4S binding protein [Pseudomonadota bacterium]